MKTPERLTLTVKAQRGMLGKLTGKYTATMLGVEQTGETKEQAVEQLTDMLDNTMRQAYARRYLITAGGVVFSLYHVPGGWAYDIIRTGTPGAYCASSCMMGESYVYAYDAMKRHFEQISEDERISRAA